MKVLWVCNIMLPIIAESLGLPYSSREGWLTGIFNRINERRKESEASLELGICFPMEELPEKIRENGSKIMVGTTSCYGFLENISNPEKYDASLEAVFCKIISDFKPDMVHIFGTEFPHCLAMVKTYGKPERTLLGIQGLCSLCAELYMADIPVYVQNRVTFRDFIRKDSIKKQQEKFFIRGEREKEAIKKTGHITGRTGFDRRETESINPDAKYHFMNETMRLPFYSGKWDAGECIPHSIFLSQGDYPLKGFHYVLSAMPGILERYPDAHIYVAGTSIIKNRSLKDKIKLSSYGKYLLELIKKNGMQAHVTVLGGLSAEEMKRQYLKSSIFLCPSALENSPNSLCEAMLLGVPAAAARTGGIPSLLEDGKEGLLYEPGNAEELANVVMQIWSEPEAAGIRAQAGRDRALEVHDANHNFDRLIEIYGEICR